MKQNYDEALKLVLVHEGGYVNHPADPGGATNKGVTQAVYNAYRRNKNVSTRSVREITSAEVAEIYRRQYADAVRFDDLPPGVDYATFDYAVNSGVSRAAKELQRVVGVEADGHIGEQTLAACKAKMPAAIINGMCDRRMTFLRNLGIWPTFGKGWTRRVTDVRAAAKRMASGTAGGITVAPVAVDHVETPAPPTPKAKQSDTSILRLFINLLLSLFKGKG